MKKLTQTLLISFILMAALSLSYASEPSQTENPNMSEAEEKALIMQALNNSAMGSTMLKQQQEQMPKMFEVLVALKECLTGADTKSEAVECDNQSVELSKKIGLDKEFYDDENDDDFTWSSSDKKTALTEMEAGLKIMQESLPCIENAKTMSDLMLCSQAFNE